MLSDRKCSECSVESSTGEGYNWLEQQKLQVHFPYLRHLIEKDDGALEQGIDFLVLGSKYSRIQLSQVFDSEDQILLQLALQLSTLTQDPEHTIFHSL